MITSNANTDKKFVGEAVFASPAAHEHQVGRTFYVIVIVVSFLVVAIYPCCWVLVGVDFTSGFAVWCVCCVVCLLCGVFAVWCVHIKTKLHLVIQSIRPKDDLISLSYVLGELAEGDLPWRAINEVVLCIVFSDCVYGFY